MTCSHDVVINTVDRNTNKTSRQKAVATVRKHRHSIHQEVTPHRIIKHDRRLEVGSLLDQPHPPPFTSSYGNWQVLVVVLQISGTAKVSAV